MSTSMLPAIISGILKLLVLPQVQGQYLGFIDHVGVQ